MSRVALVTGGSRGIGRSIAERLGTAGHRVAVNYAQRAEAAADAVAAVEAAGGEAIPVQADVGEEGDVARMFEEVEAKLGPVEILVNNAGTTGDELLLRMKPELFDEIIRVNLRSTYLCTRAAMRAMVRARWGRIVSISSVAGVVGNPGQANYSAAKAGVIGFSQSVAKEVGSRNITVNVVAPGFITTDLTDGVSDKVRDIARSSTTLGRFGEAHEVSSLVGYLCSDEASYVTGQVIRVDGGLQF